MSIFNTALQERQPTATRLLDSAFKRRLLANAYLLTGRLLADKWRLAQSLAAALNCLNENELFSSCLITNSLPESFCRNCKWISQDQHPQAYIVLSGQGESGKIPVEKARQLVDELSKTSKYTRVVVIPQAEQEFMHAAPANALLKSIEESRSDVMFLLFAASSLQVLPTIVSRCQQIPLVDRLDAGLWLDGSSLKNLETENSELAGKLASLKSGFIHDCRKRLSGRSSLHGSNLKAAAESQEIGKRLVELCETSELDAELLIDLFLAAELAVLKDFAIEQRQIAAYMKALAELCENSKSQLGRFVKRNNVLETFAFSLTELQIRYLGDFQLAKH